MRNVEDPRQNLGRDNGAVQDTDTINEEVGGLIDVLVKQAVHDESIIEQMAAAVKKEDKDTVFQLAEELTDGNR